MPAINREIRLWDTQWVNVVNRADCYADYTKEEAIAMAVKLTEKYMAENFENNEFPPNRKMEQAA
jgi:predicted oxidoreductase